MQRLVDYVESGLNFNEALELVKASSLYTVHTPVPAGHDYFDEGLFGKYMGAFLPNWVSVGRISLVLEEPTQTIILKNSVCQHSYARRVRKLTV